MQRCCLFKCTDQNSLFAQLFPPTVFGLLILLLQLYLLIQTLNTRIYSLESAIHFSSVIFYRNFLIHNLLVIFCLNTLYSFTVYILLRAFCFHLVNYKVQYMLIMYIVFFFLFIYLYYFTIYFSSFFCCCEVYLILFLLYCMSYFWAYHIYSSHAS